MKQDERLYILVEGFKADSGEYRNIPTPESTDEKRQLLRYLHGCIPFPEAARG